MLLISFIFRHAGVFSSDDDPARHIQSVQVPGPVIFRSAEGPDRAGTVPSATEDSQARRELNDTFLFSTVRL